MRMASLTNTSILSTKAGDILYERCYGDLFDAVACARYSVMSAVILVTAILCVVRIYQLHRVGHGALHHYFIFYSSTFCCILCLVHWLIGDYAQLDFLAQWFKLAAYLFVTHSLWTRAHQTIQTDKLTNCCLLPGLLLGLIYCTTTVILGAVMVTNYQSACRALEWVMMSSAELLIVQTFLIAAFFISKRLNAISTVEIVRTSQQRKLWGLVIVFEISAIASFSYDLAIRILGEKYQTCQEIFSSEQWIYSLVYGTFMIIKYALPMWAMLAALDAVPTLYRADEDFTESFHSTQSAVGDRRNQYIPRLFQSLRRDDS